VLTICFFYLVADPFSRIRNFLIDDVVTGLLSIATPIAALGFIGLSLAAMLATDEHQRQKFKSGLWWIGGATTVCFLSQLIVNWLKESLG
jgi:hypothetical protein